MAKKPQAPAKSRTPAKKAAVAPKAVKAVAAPKKAIKPIKARTETTSAPLKQLKPFVSKAQRPGWVKPAPAAVVAPAPEAAKPAEDDTLSLLTVKQEAFVLAYIECGNASRAYREVYDAENMKPGTVWTEACLLLQNPKVAKRLRALRDQITERLLMTKADVIAETTKLATFDVRRLFDADGAPIPFHELDPDTAACIVGIEVLEEFEGTGKERRFVGFTKKYKVADKKGALDMLAKHHGIYEKDNEQKLNPLVELLKSMGGKSAFPVVKDAPK
ncbi:Terminase small subunit [compost metagenome]